MFTPELLLYIETELKAGRSQADICDSLLAAGWQQNDIDSAWKKLSNLSATRNNKIHKKTIGVLVGIICIAGVIISIFTFSKQQATTSQSKPSSVGNSLGSLLSMTRNRGTEYTTPDSSYSLQYPENWTVNNQTGSTSIVSPETAATKEYKELPFGEVVITKVPYSNNTDLTNEQKARDLAELAASNKTVKKVTYNGFTGFSSVSEASQGNILNVVLAGEKNIIYVQFINVSSEDELDQNKKMILETIKEM